MFTTDTMTKLCPFCAEEIQAAAVKCKHCQSWISENGPHRNSFFRKPSGKPRRLLRSTTDRKISGICGGMAEYLNVDPTLIRMVGALATVCTAVVPGAAIYLVLIYVIPEDTDPSVVD